MEYLTFAALSKLFAATATYPYQVVRARLQDQYRDYKGVMDVVSQTWRYEGVRGFYKGLSPYMVHVTPNICLVFLIYEMFTGQRWPERKLEFIYEIGGEIISPTEDGSNVDRTSISLNFCT